MEVKNQMVDQLLVNTAAQTPAKESAKTAKDANRPDFDSMVQKRSAEKNAPKPDKASAKDAAKGKAEPAATEEAPVTDEQYAAAAMLLQTPAEIRVTPVEEAVAAVPEDMVVEITLDAPRAETAEMTPELPELQAVQEAPAEAVAETVGTVAADEAPETNVPEQKTQAPVISHETKTDDTEAKPAVGQKTERVERQDEPMTRAERTDAPRAQKTAEALRFVRSEARAETEGDDAEEENTSFAPETPLFERVDAPVVKVAEASRPIPLEAEDGTEQLGREIGDVIVNDVSANRIEVQLTPGSLGKLTVEISRGENGALHIVLHAESQRAANLLEKGVDGLRQAIAASREHDAQIEVRGNEETREQFLNPDDQNEQNRQQHQQQHNGRRDGQQNAQDFLQQLRLGLVDVDEDKN